jgi:undecaprenyl diphosphate synthase
MADTKIPRHVALIMDGNRRWARQRGWKEVEGHRQGVKVLKPLIQRGLDLGIEVMTFWAFSTKNFKRDVGFLSDIMTVFREALDNKKWFEEIKEAGGQINIIGDPKKFPQDILKKLQEYLGKSQPEKTKMIVNFALEYEGRDEIVRAIKKAKKAEVEGKLDLGNLTVEQFDNFLDTAGMPDPDLMIRTGGDIRISGYLLWQIADTELYFTETLWPDFTPERLNEALDEYANRERRFGK